jgi:DNA-binding NarL/FixJ family response regulator
MGKKPRILFVDDEPSVLNGLRRSFREVPWEMLFLNSPKEAITECRERPVDVVVSDMRMPGMNGVELIIELRRYTPETAYIILTGAGDLRGAIDSINRAGVYRFYTKPCPSFLLKEGIDSALQARSPRCIPMTLNGPSSSVGETALDQLSIAVIVVDVSGRMLFMNRRGGELCAKDDGLTIGAAEICYASTPSESSRLHQMISESATAGTRKALAVSRPSMKRPLLVVVAPLPTFSDGRGNGKAAALYISDPEHNTVPPPEQLAALLELPPAKAKLAYCIAQGKPLDEAAIKLSITTETARTYLKDIFARTGTSRQAELVKLILSHPAVDI